MVHDFVDASTERSSLFSFFLLPKGLVALWINTFKKGGNQNENEVPQQTGRKAQDSTAAGQAAMQQAQGGCK